MTHLYKCLAVYISEKSYEYTPDIHHIIAWVIFATSVNVIYQKMSRCFLYPLEKYIFSLSLFSVS